MINKKKVRVHGCELWTINQYLRWTGYRLTVVFPSGPDEPTKIGVSFWGWWFLFE